MTENALKGWACAGKGEPLVETEFPLKPFDDDTIELKITHCGICASDIHTLGKLMNIVTSSLSTA